MSASTAKATCSSPHRRPRSRSAKGWTNDNLNAVKTHTDGRGNTTSYGYDTAGNLTTITGADPDGAGPLDSPGARRSPATPPEPA